MARTSLSPIPRPSLAGETRERLRRAILNGELPGGTPLPEAATAERLGVSRVPVREALAELERQGLVVFAPTGRASVRRFEREDFLEILTLRASLQSLAAREAARRSTAEDLRRLEANVRRTADARGLAEVSALDTAFHDEVVALAGHARLSRAWADLRPQMELWLARLHRKREGLRRDVRDATHRAHRDFLKVLERRRPEQAARWMEEHCLSWLDSMPDLSEDA